MKKKKVIITLDWEQCNLIARYYEFPASVFFFTKSTMEEAFKGTRKNAIREKMEDFRSKLNQLFEDAKEAI